MVVAETIAADAALVNRAFESILYKFSRGEVRATESRLFFSFSSSCSSAGRAKVASRPDNESMKQTGEEHIEVEGVVSSVLAGTMFRVQLDNKHTVLATISGKMRKRFVRITTGDRVKMEMSPYDLNKGRITWRLR